MFIRSVISASAALLCTAAAQGRDDPLTRPLAVERESTWLAPRPPIRVFGNSYLVGFGGLSVALIDTGKGLILIASTEAQLADLLKIGRSTAERWRVTGDGPPWVRLGPHFFPACP